MIELRGAHGTSASRAQDINEHGFNPSVGRQGEGVYFWRENEFARELAIGWYLNARNLGSYSNDRDKRCAIIHAICTIFEEEFLDLDDPDNYDGILSIYKSRGYNDAVDASKLYEEFIDLVQENLGVKIKVIQTRVMAPKTAKSWPWQLMGRPFCYLVKDSACITVVNIEILENGAIEQ